MNEVVEFFQNKNPQATMTYCDLAATLYEVLLEHDAFENGVQINNFNESFSFLFPKGEIIIGKASPYDGIKKTICYFVFKRGECCSITFYNLGQLCSWLQENWDDLIKAV